MNTIQIDVINEKTGRKYGAKFETKLQADEWIEKQKSKRSWGKADVWKVVSAGLEHGFELVETTEAVYDESTGEIVTEAVIDEIKVAELTITDITGEEQAKVDAKAAKKQLKDALKSKAKGKSMTLEEIQSALELLLE